MKVRLQAGIPHMDNKYLVICFQVFVYEEQLSHCEPRMNADERRCSSAVCEGCPSDRLSGLQLSEIMCNHKIR